MHEGNVEHNKVANVVHKLKRTFWSIHARRRPAHAQQCRRVFVARSHLSFPQEHTEGS